MQLETMKTRIKAQKPDYKCDTGYIMLRFPVYRALLSILTPGGLTASQEIISGGQWLMPSGEDRQEPCHAGLAGLGKGIEMALSPVEGRSL